MTNLAGSALELIEPQRTIVEVIEDDERVVYLVEPTVIQPVPRELSDLEDVSPAAPADGQVIGWNAGAGTWEPTTVASGGSGGGLTVTDTDALYYRKPVVDTALAGKEATGTAAAAVLAHTAASDPHPQYVRTTQLDGYTTDSELATGLAGKANTVHTHGQGDITGLTAALAGKEATGTAAAAVTAHTGAADPHPQYLTVNEGDARFGNLFKEAEQDGRLDTLEARPVIDSPDDIGAQPAGDYATNTALTTGLAGKAPLASPTFTGTVTTPRIVTPPVALVDAATVATDAAAGNHFRVTLGGNRTLGAPTNPVDGQKALWELIQDGTGSRTLTLATGAGGFLVGADGPVTLSTVAGTRDFLGAVYIATLNRWVVLALAKGFGP